MALETRTKIPLVTLNSGHSMPVVGTGTFGFPFVPETAKAAIIEAIKIGYRHFDTASIYGANGVMCESVLGEAIAEAVQLGLIGSRKDVFITSKLWCMDAHPELVLPALKSTLRNLQMEYLDLYLIHWPIAQKKTSSQRFPIKREDVILLDVKGVWAAMEECQRQGLAKSIGVSNFTTKKLEELLEFAEVLPAVNQVEVNLGWQQKKVREYCAKKGIHITAHSPLGGPATALGPNPVLSSDLVKEIADAKAKTAAQISLRWLLQQGISVVGKSFNKERLRQNLDIFDWELSDEEELKLGSLPQDKRRLLEFVLAKEGSLSSVDISDIEIIET